VATEGQPRVRRTSDIFKSVLGLLLVLWAVITDGSVAAWDQAFTDLVQSGPGWVSTLLAVGYGLSLVYLLVVIGALVFGGRERRSALRDLVIVALGAAALGTLLSFVVNGAWPYVLPEVGLEDPVPRFPVLRVAMVTAVLLVVSPYLTRPVRRFGWFAIITTAIASVGLSYGTPSQTIGSFGVGLLAAGLLLWIEGSPRGYPDPDTVSAAMAELGVPVRSLDIAPYQTWGVIRFLGWDDRGDRIDIKAHGRDAFDSQLAAKVWHTLWYRGSNRTVSYTRLQAVEHEALITMLADRAGLPVPQLATVGSATDEIALISFRSTGVALNELGPDEITDDLLIEAWSNVALLHEETMSHGALDTSAVEVRDGAAIITDFGLGSLAADKDDQAGDVVELLFSLAVLVGEDRAVATALRGLGRDRLAAVLPFVQVPAVSPTSRRLVEKPKNTIAALSSKIAETTGAEVPEPVKLRRVTLRSVVMGALLLLVASALIPLFTSVDYAQIWSVLQTANWPLLGVALVFGHTQFFPLATATMFAISVKLAFWPVLVLQTASQFISLAIPSAAGRVAMNTAFLHKFGLSVTAAVVQGSIDGFTGFLVQAAILIVLLVFGNVDLGLHIDASDVPWLLVLGIVALIAIGVVVAILRIRKLRDRVVPVIKEAWHALAVVLRQPSRAFGLLGSNFLYWNILGITLWLILQAVGADLDYGSALFVAAGTSLLAGFMPIPGGVGVAEATMTALLATFGVDQSTAFAATAVYRVITFYLPALEGFFGTRWLEKHGYL
jgi:glycosyltransferase 2 family protein